MSFICRRRASVGGCCEWVCMAEEVLITLVVLGAIIVVLLWCFIILICVRGPFKSPPHGLPAALPPQHSIGDAEVDALPAAVEAAAGETSGGDNAAAQAFSLSGAATDGGRDEASRSPGRARRCAAAPTRTGRPTCGNRSSTRRRTQREPSESRPEAAGAPRCPANRRRACGGRRGRTARRG